MTPGVLIRTARLRAGLTQVALAQRAGTSQPVVSAYEHDRRDPSSETLRRLLAAAGARLRLGSEPIGDGDRTRNLAPPSDLAEHGRRLLDVLSLADAIPARRRPAALGAPRLVSK